ncbi:protein PF3D7_1417600-like [Saccostrea echinata]|uniref:protein PF3D7_1417600-like n=1 Tax=Saccostrea echinata TaxID=191078 RepID=UPI002A80B510|nr:protein PF3D7_1417600-like [Saccostrea echinata]
MFELPDDDDNFWEDLPLDDITNNKSPKQKASNSGVPRQCEIQSHGTSKTVNYNNGNEKQKPCGRNKNGSLGEGHSPDFNKRGDLFTSSSGEGAAKNNCISGVENTTKTTFSFKPVNSTNCDSVSLDEIKVNGTEKGELKTGKRLSSESMSDSSKKIRLHDGTVVGQFLQSTENRSDYWSQTQGDTQLIRSTTRFSTTTWSITTTQSSHPVGQGNSDRTYQLKTSHPQKHTLETSTTQSPNPVGQGNSGGTYQLRTSHSLRHTQGTTATHSPSPVGQDNSGGTYQLRTSHSKVLASARRQCSGVTRNINTTPVIKKAKRKFPGPAGLLPRLSDNSENIKESVTPSLKISPDKITVEKEDTILSSQSVDDIFSEEPWRTLMEELGPDGQQLLHNFSIANNLTKARKKQLYRGKVPLLMCVIDNIDWHGSDLSVSLKDRSGEVQGTVHRDIMKEFESELQVGSALVLRQVSVISPNPRSHYLNITPANIVFIYSKNGDSCQLVNTRNTSLSSVLEEVQRQESIQRHLMNQSVTVKTPSRSLAHTQQFHNRTPQFVGRPSTPYASQMLNNRTQSFGGRPSTPCNPQMNNRTPQFPGRPATPSNLQISNSTPRVGGRTTASNVRTPSTVFDEGNSSARTPFNSQNVKIPTPILQHAENRTPSIQTVNRNVQSVSSASSTSVPSTSSSSHFQGIKPQNQSGGTPISNQTNVNLNITSEYDRNLTTVNHIANVNNIPSGVHPGGIGNNSQELNNNQQCTPNRRSFKFKPSRNPEIQSITNNNSSSVSTRATSVFTPSLQRGANQTSNNSASLLQQGDKPKFEVDSVWGEDLSDDVLSQLSEEF